MQTSVPAPKKSNWLKLLVLLIVAALAVFAYLSVSHKKMMPDVTFVDLQGEKITTQDLRGKVVMVNFWATSCVTCVKEMPEMVETFKKYHAQGLEFVAVAMAYDPPNYVLNFVETRKLPFMVTLDTQGKLAKAFGDIQLTPTTLLIDKNGHIIKTYVGEPDFPALHQLLEKELAA